MHVYCDLYYNLLCTLILGSAVFAVKLTIAKLSTSLVHLNQVEGYSFSSNMFLRPPHGR